MPDTGEISIVTSLRLSKALGLARGGRLREAQQLLAREGTLPENSTELHALAALATGEGDYARALRLWRLLLQREPGHAEAKRMIDCIELWLSRPPWMGYIPVALAAVAIGIIVSIVIIGTSGPAPVPVPAPRPAITRSTAAPAYQKTEYTTPAERAPSVVFPSTTPPAERRRRSGR